MKIKKLKLNHSQVKALVAIVAVVLVSVGAAWIYPPAGLIVAGLMLFFDSQRKDIVEDKS